MNTKTGICCLLVLISCSCSMRETSGGQAYISVDPFIGTGGHGHTFPGATTPHGMVQLSPDTRAMGWDGCSGYHYSDSSILGFSHTHLSGTGIGDYGDILFMPFQGETLIDEGDEENPDSGYRSRFSHSEEKAEPGYYAVRLSDDDINVELTASTRAGFHRYKFNKRGQAGVIIDLTHTIHGHKNPLNEIRAVSDTEIAGAKITNGWAVNHHVYFYAEFNKPFTYFLVDSGMIVLETDHVASQSAKAVLLFDVGEGEELLAKVGISSVDIDGARNNLNAEINHWDFDKVVADAKSLWQNHLNKIIVEGGDDDSRKIFYTALYHCSINPSIFMDTDNRYRGVDGKIHKADGFNKYTVFSLWDTFRALHPLLTIIDPERDNDFINSLLSTYDEGGILPKWELAGNYTGTMIGYHAVSVIADAFMKGIRDYDIEKAYRACMASSLYDTANILFPSEEVKAKLMPVARKYYNELGYAPSDLAIKSVSEGLEYAYSDWCIAQMAKELNDQDTYNRYMERSMNYKHHFDPATGFMRGKTSGGEWETPFNPRAAGRSYVEGNAWQWSWYVPHDVEGYITLMGGKDAFVRKLDSLFSIPSYIEGERRIADATGLIGQYAHGNEPSHHIAYLYNYVGMPWKTQQLVDSILYSLYFNDPDGLSGNEDCGQMSAWYIFSSLGFYPVFTASGEYVLGSPLFDKATINLENGKQFTVETVNNSEDNIYIQSVELNGKDYPYSYITHNDIVSGGKLKFVMGKFPNYNFGKDEKLRPEKEIIGNFKHPGMLQSKEDMEYMKQKVLSGTEPWKTAFENLKKNVSTDFQPEPFTIISVGPYGANSSGGREYERSANAAYNNAMLWYITGEKSYSDKSIEILNAWSKRLWGFDDNNAKLNVGLFAPLFLNAAEILKYTDSGWKAEDEEQFRRMVLTVFYPTIRDFFTEANGNWDASIIYTMFCIGIYTDNHEIFNRGLQRYYYGIGNSGITKYIYPTGQCQETTRDWGHVQLGIGEFAKAAQAAWTQGIDLYSSADDRLALGFEYTAKYLLGGEIPVFGVLSHRANNQIRDIYESIYEFYKSEKGIEMPYTKQLIDTKTRKQSSIGVLTAFRASEKETIMSSGKTLQPDLKTKFPSETGALPYLAENKPSGAIVVKEGESIQDAIDRSKGEPVILEKGIFTLKAPLKIKSGTKLAGQGKETVLFLSPELRTATVINAEKDIHDVEISNLLIEGAISTKTNDDPNHDRRSRSYMSAPSREGILFSGDFEGQMKNISLINITVQNCTKSGVSIKGAEGVKILNCDISDNGASVVPGAGFHHNLLLLHVLNAEIKNNRFDTSPHGCGIYLSFDRNIDVSYNETARNAQSGIRFSECENMKVNNNLVEGNDDGGIFQEILMNKSKNVEINENILRLNGKL